MIATVEEEPSSRRWKRPALKSFDPSTETFEFQCLDVDYSVIESTSLFPSRFGESRSAVIRMYGVTDAGNSVMVHAHNFEPYFYVNAWDGMTQADLHAFGDVLNSNLQSANRETKSFKRAIHDIVMLSEGAGRRSVWGFRDRAQSFLKITVALPSMVATARRILERGIQVGQQYRTFHTYESNIPFVLRFMVDHKVSGGSWLSLPASKYVVRRRNTGSSSFSSTTSSSAPALDSISHCQLEVDIRCSDLISHPSEGVYQRLAPIRVLSFDIECEGRRGHFPTADQDPVIQIANVIQIAGQTKPLLKSVFTLGSCAAIAEAHVVSSETESELLRKWRSFFVQSDADVIIGYNINNFDFPYLLDRAEVRTKGNGV